MSVTLNGGNQDNDADGEFAFSNPSFNPDTGRWEILVNDSDDLTFARVNLEIQASDGENAGSGLTRITLVPDVIDNTVEDFEENSPEETAIPLEIEDSDTPLNELEVTLINGNQDIDGDRRSAFNQPTFNTEAGQWEVTVNDSDDLNFENLSPEQLENGEFHFSLEIEASDGEDSDTGEYDVRLADINEAPVFENSSQLLSVVDIDGIPNDDGNGAIVGQITGFTDPDGDVSDPEGQDFRFSINEVGGFNLDSATITATGEIFIGDRAQLGDNLEFEVTVIDSEGAESEPILIGIPADTAENDAPLVLDTTLERVNPSTAAIDNILGTVPSADPDGDPISFSIDGGNDSGAFAINENGEISLVVDPATLNQAEFTLTVTATDSVDSNLTDTAEVTIPVNTAPFLSSETVEIPENSGNDTVIALPLSDVDTPIGGLVSVTLRNNQDNDGDDLNAFSEPAFNEETGQWEITITDSDELNLDFETSEGLTVDISVSDGDITIPSSINVDLTDVNEAPTVEDATFDEVDPRSIATDDLVDGITVNDPEGEPVNLEITDGNDPDGNGIGAFAIDAEGNITIADLTELTELTTTNFTLTVTATDTVDETLPSDTATVTIPIAPVPIVDEPIPVVNNSFTEIAETSADGTPIPLEITDENTNLADLTVNILNGNPDNDGDGTNVFSEPVFNPDSGQLQITVTDSDELNAEGFPDRFSLEIEATDDLGADTATITVELDEAPTVDDAVLNSVDPADPENPIQAGDLVGTVDADDPEGDAFTLAITDGNDPDGDTINAFDIDPNSGTITIADPAELTQDFSILEVTATQDDDPSLTSTGQIIIPTPTNPLPVINDSQIDLPENSAVLPLDIQDGNNLADLTVTLLDGNQDNDSDETNVFGEPEFNDTDQQWELPITDSDEFDLENFPNSFNLEIEATDDLGADTATITVELDEAPTVDDAVLNSVDPTTALVGDTVGFVSDSDPEGDAFTLAITDGNNPDGDTINAFDIDPNSGTITIADPAELTQDFFILEVTATQDDNDSLTSTGQIIIPTPTNPLPVINDSPIDLPENSAVLPLDIQDGNNLADLTVTLLDGNQDNDSDETNVFGEPEFNDTDQQWELPITDSDELDLEDSLLPDNFNLEIEVIDPDPPAISADLATVSDFINVSLTNVNEAPVVEEEVLNTVDPDFAFVDQDVDTISVSDPDFNDSIASVEITSGNTDADGDGIDAFRIDEDFGNFELIVQDPDDLTEDFFTLEVTATDNEGLTGTGEVIVPTPINPFPVIDGSNIDLPENSSVLTLNIQDENTDLQELTVTLVDGNQDNDEDGTNVFGDTQFNSETGEWELLITDTDELDFEQFPNQEFNLEIEAIDPQGNSDSVSSTVSLVDVNEIQDSTLSVDAAVAEEEPLVGSLSISEPNDGLGVNNVTILDGNDPNGNGVDAFAVQQNGLGEFELIVQNPEELTQSSFTLEVEATGGGAITGTAEITIDVSSVRPVIESNPLKLLEDSVEGDTVALNIRDEDTNSENLIVTLVGGNQDLDEDGQFAFGEPIFNSEFGQWEVPVNDTDDLDFEADYNLDDGDPETGTFTLEVHVSDGATSAIAEPEIQLTDVNEAPILEPQTLELDVNAVTAEFEQNQENAEEEEEIVLPVVGTIEVEEPDGQNVSLAITGGNDPDGNDRSAFTITEDNFGELELQVQNPEELTQDFTLQVTATDDSDDALTTTTDLTIELTAIPTFEADDPIPLPENSPEGTVIPLDIQDANTPLEELTVTLEDGNQDNDGDGNFVFSNPSFNQETGQWELTVTDSDELDFEATESFDLEIEVRDQENGTTAFPTIAVEDINEAPQVEAQTIEVNANTAFQLQPLDRIETSEPDFGQSVETSAITGGNDPDGNEVNAFIINESNRLTVLNPDELTQDFTLTITATDNSAEQVTGTGEINVSVTAAPIVTNDPIPLPENSPEGTVIPLNINDLNTPNGDLTVNLNGGNQDLDGDGIFAFSNPSFNTDAGQWELTVTDPDELDFESDNNRFPLELQASDGEQANSGSPEIVLTDVNEAPVGNDITLPLLNTATIEAGEVIGNASITDPEGDLLEFAINSGDDNGAFTIDEAGDISIVDPSLISAPFQLEISATETETDEQNATTAVVTVPVDTPPAFVETEFTVPENSAIDFEVGQVVINEDEGLESLSLDSANFDGDENPALRIDEQGNVFVNDADDIDFEANSGLLLGELTATNVNGLTQSAILTVNVQDVNEIPTVEEALFSPIAVGESSIAQDDQVEIDPVISDDLTGVVSANDPDLGESPTLDIIAGNNDADGDGTEAVAIQSFADGGAEIIVTDPDDVRENFRLTVQVSDRGGDTNEATVVIPVNGEGNQAPIAENATLNIVENSSGGTVVGTFPHTDPDFNNLLSQEDLTFSINQGNTDVDGDGLSAFRIDRFSGEILVADRDDLNFESADNRSFELEVVVTDLEGATDTAEVTVNLEDVNEAPVINNRFLERVTLNPITNPTEAADGDIVGAIAASDPDGTALSYEILSGNDPEENLADAFAINSDGEVSIANIEEIPDSGFFPLTVAISDETGLTTETELVIPLGTQAPTIAADQSFTIPEDAAFETVVGTVSATEPDGEEISYFLASSQQEGLPAFEIDRATGEIVVTAPNALDFETQSTVELTVIARDPQQAIGVETVTVNLENVNEAPTFDENSTSFAIPASSQAGRGVGVVAAFDEDGDTVSYAIVGGNDDRDGDDTNPFTINAETGEVTVADADDLLTLEDNPFRLEVQARDGELNNTAEVDITALPAAPVIPNNGATFPINATSFAGALVDTVEAFDPDEGELSFAFSAGNEDRDGDENNPFRINTETGAIIVTDADDVADIEGNPFELSVLVTDEDGDTTTGNFTVTSGTGTVSTSDGISFSTPLPDQSEAELEQDLNDDGDTEDTVTPEPSNLVRPAIGSTEILSIENTGNAPLLISDVVVSEGLRDRVTTDFEALVEAATPVDDNGEALFDLPGVEIPVGANLELAVTYTPDAGGEVIDEAAGLTLFSNDPENGELNVALSGESTFNSDIDYNGSVGFPDVTLADSLFNTSSEELNPALNIDGEGGFGFSDLATLNQEFGASIA
ncbi:cadherin repeat domain-containing protein [Dactylococcopsis salina]|uniref:Cadherin domain-containing protein n=1 Tax=Dactylococcopsis salina (strain PCC 8305) TaxID=13035 RepID=K9YSP2_DACS8|nr:cadherin repeat domain-containing protein [Dactylococcopsis salina]AFZ49128.1 Cadherin domain-containing protein [Dactylococcopsis salina PCC 8305]